MTMTIFESTDGISPRSAATYHLSPVDARGRPRAGIEILGGSPESVLRIAEKVPFQQKFKHSVTPWAATDQPSNQEIQSRVQDEIRFACAGLNSERIAYYACVHRRRVNLDDIVNQSSPVRKHLPNDLYRVDMHTFIVCIDLLTQKPFNPVPWPNDIGYVYLSDAYDWRYGYARPGDFRRKRLYRPSQRKPFVSHLERQGIEVSKTVNDSLGEECEAAVISGLISDHKEMLMFLGGYGTIEHIRDESITILHKSGVRVRLQGEMYRRDFSFESISITSQEVFVAERLRMMAYWNAQTIKSGGGQHKSILASDHVQEDPSVLQFLANAASSRSNFEDALNKRAEYNLERYCRNIVVGVKSNSRKSDVASEIYTRPEDDVVCSSIDLLKTKQLMLTPNPWLNPPRTHPESVRKITALEGISSDDECKAHHSFLVMEQSYARQYRTNHIEFARDKIDHVGRLCEAAGGSIRSLVDELQKYEVELDQSARNACRSIEQNDHRLGAKITSRFGRWNVEFDCASSAACRSVVQRIETLRREFGDERERRDRQMARGTGHACELFEHSFGKAERAIKDGVAQSRKFRELRQSLSARSANAVSVSAKTGFIPK